MFFFKVILKFYNYCSLYKGMGGPLVFKKYAIIVVAHKGMRWTIHFQSFYRYYYCYKGVRWATRLKKQ